jgi:hypothetical protein
MTISNAHKEVYLGAPGPPEAGMRIRPGPGSWLAFLVVGAFVIVWMRQEQIAIWVLSEGIVGEGATQGLISAVRWISVVGAVASLVTARRVALFGASITLRFGPTRVLALVLTWLFGPMIRPVGLCTTCCPRSWVRPWPSFG